MASIPGSDRPTDDTSGTSQPGSNGEVAVGLSLAKASERLIERFGGIRPMASKLEVPVTTVQGWKKRGAIPPTRLNDLRAAARRHGIKLEEAELDVLGRTEERGLDSAAAARAAETAETSGDDTLSKPDQSATRAARRAAELALAIAPVEIPPARIPPARVTTTAAMTVGGTTTAAMTVGGTTTAAMTVGGTAAPAVPPPSPPPAPPPPPPDVLPPVPPTAPPDVSVPDPTPIPPSDQPLPAPSAEAGVEARVETPVAAAPPPAPPGLIGPSAGSDQPGGIAPPESGGNSWAGLSIAAAVIALLGAGIAVTSPFWSAPPPGQPLPPAALQKRLGELETKITRVALERGTAPAEIEKRFDQLEATVTHVSTDHGTALTDIGTRVAAIEKMIPALNQKLVGLPSAPPALAMLLATAQLRTALATANPFQGELAAVEMSGLGDPGVRQALDLIAERAAIGIPTSEWLIERFPEVERAILRAATAGNPIAGLGDQLMGLLSAVAPPVYRFATSLDSAGVRAITDRAEAWMSASDLARAVDQLSSLVGPAGDAALPWLTEARARVGADRVRILLGQRMIALLPSTTAAPK